MCPKVGVLPWGFRPSHPLVGANASRSHRALAAALSRQKPSIFVVQVCIGSTALVIFFGEQDAVVTVWHTFDCGLPGTEPLSVRVAVAEGAGGDALACAG